VPDIASFIYLKRAPWSARFSILGNIGPEPISHYIVRSAISATVDHILVDRPLNGSSGKAKGPDHSGPSTRNLNAAYFFVAAFLAAFFAAFLGAAFLAAFLGAAFLAAFLGAAFFAPAFLAAAFFGAAFLATFLAPAFLALAFLGAAGFLAVTFFTVFFATFLAMAKWFLFASNVIECATCIRKVHVNSSHFALLIS